MKYPHFFKTTLFFIALLCLSAQSGFGAALRINSTDQLARVLGGLADDIIDNCQDCFAQLRNRSNRGPFPDEQVTKVSRDKKMQLDYEPLGDDSHATARMTFTSEQLPYENHQLTLYLRPDGRITAFPTKRVQGVAEELTLEEGVAQKLEARIRDSIRGEARTQIHEDCAACLREAMLGNIHNTDEFQYPRSAGFVGATRHTRGTTQIPDGHIYGNLPHGQQSNHARFFFSPGDIDRSKTLTGRSRQLVLRFIDR